MHEENIFCEDDYIYSTNKSKFYWKSIFSLYLFLDDVSVIAIAPSIKQLQ